MAQSGPVDRASDRWASIVLSVALHGAIVAAIVYSWYTYKHDRPAPTLAIEASVVDAKTVPGLGKLPPQPVAAPPPPVAPPPEPPPPDTQPQVEPDGPPQPTPEELAKREQEQKEQAEKEAQAKQQEVDRKREEQEKQQEAALAEEKAAEDKRADEKRLADEQAKKAQEKADAERKAREAADAKKKADEKRLAEEKQKADQQAAADREADLKRSLDQELRQDAARSSGALASWQSQITARIQRAWLRPASARSGIECVLNVTQVPGGEVTNVRIGTCNGDQAVRESIEAAVYRASPLPPPPDPSLFERSLVITFRPD
jgi:colicin import membrane protein